MYVKAAAGHDDFADGVDYDYDENGDYDAPNEGAATNQADEASQHNAATQYAGKYATEPENKDLHDDDTIVLNTSNSTICMHRKACSSADVQP